jgi:hypothetical protein
LRKQRKAEEATVESVWCCCQRRVVARAGHSKDEAVELRCHVRRVGSCISSRRLSSGKSCGSGRIGSASAHQIRSGYSVDRVVPSQNASGSRLGCCSKGLRVLSGSCRAISKCIWVETRVLQQGAVRSEQIVDGNRNRMKRDAAIAAVRQDQDAECTGAERAGAACGKAQLEAHGHA